MHVRFALFSKIMIWFFLNLLLLAAIFLLLFNHRFAPDSPFFHGTDYRIENISHAISEETSEKSRSERDEVLRRYSENYAVEFFMFDNAGRQIAGREIVLPPEISKEIIAPESEFAPRRLSVSPNQPPKQPLPPKFGSFSSYFKTTNPTVYWYATRTMTFESNSSEPIRSRIIAASDSFTGKGLFFDPTPWLVIIGLVTIVSMLFWLPFVRNLTRNLAQMTNAAEQIAEENFEARVSDRRTDELGRLGAAINHLASRLSGFVSGQKRFLGDISHELNSPLARMQFALSILEDRVDEKNRDYVVDVKEEVELMSKLVSELLAYSKAGIKTTQIELESIALRQFVGRVVERETATEKADIKIEIAENIEVCAQPELLARALANVVRNAVRYAGRAGEILIAAKNTNGKQVEITVADNGAGVPDAALEKIFDPLYRVESDRSRQSGGTGLGLAIVKTCVEACGGRVSAQNRFPHGFAVTILLKA